MKTFIYFLCVLILLGVIACSHQVKNQVSPDLITVVDTALKRACKQSVRMAESLRDEPERLPRTIDSEGKLVTSSSSWWCSGFFPGVLWYLYESSKDSILKDYAQDYTYRVEDQMYTTDNHDVGFMIFCSFGNAYRLTGKQYYKNVIDTASQSLISRYRESTGCIRSWDYANWNKQWQYPVIIDNMMNLEMLMWASKEFNTLQFSDVAISHANTTLKNHFRKDNSSYHVVSYDTVSGLPELKQTSQGYSDESAWARGQAWGLYGYSMMFRETLDSTYLIQANRIADFIINNKNLPKDKIPYWDFNDPAIPNTKRDASAAAIMCSALLELSQYVDSTRSYKYLTIAENQLRILCSDEYLAKEGGNGNFILKHGVGHMPNSSEVDVPLTYGDYYFVEALIRYKRLKNRL